MLDIIIDTREKSKLVTNWLPKQFPDVNFTFKTLQEGDFQSKSCIIERKSIDDLWNSIHDGRFRTQVSRICTHQCDKVVMYLILGSVDDYIAKMNNFHIKIDEDLIHGAVSSLLIRDNIRVLCYSNEKQGLKQMVKSIKKIEEENILNFPSSRDCDMLMARILNVPKTTWFNIKDVHGSSLSHLCTLSAKEFLKIPGIGPKKSKFIYDTLHNGW